MADTAVETIRKIMEENGMTPTTAKTVVPALEDLGDAIAAGGGGGKSLGISGASVGQIPVVKTVDEDGKPTEWEAQTPSGVTYTLTVALATTDGTAVTGQTVTLREGSSTGTVIGEQSYSGEPVTFSLPGGYEYYLEATDNMRLQGPPSTASGVMTGAKSVTLTYAALNSVLEKDSQTGRYTNASLAEWWRRQRDGKVFGITMPKSSATSCTKTDDGADIANPIPGWLNHPAVDAYDRQLGPFRRVDVNGGVDPDGTQYVTAISEIDDEFALDGSNGEALSMTPTRYRVYDTTGENVVFKVSDTHHDGLDVCEGGLMPDGSICPYMLFAKYGGVKGQDGKMHSYSGFPIWNREVSHNSMITQCDTANTGYSGKTVADLQYIQDMWLAKYAGKDMQTVLMGCSNYYCDYEITVAETGVRRAIIASSQAVNLVVGSSVTIGTSAYGAQILKEARITSIEEYDSTNSVINIDAAEDFNTAVGNRLNTGPWFTGRTDDVDGDGAYTQAGLLSGKEPCVIQGIECFYGVTEVLANVIIANDGQSGWVPYVNHDTKYEATSLTDAYVSCGAALPTDTTDSWKYPLYPEEHEGLQYGTTTGSSTTIGLCDGHYTNKLETVGLREWLSGGYLDLGRSAGPWCAYASHELGASSRALGSRLSVRGRSRAAA